MTLGQSTKRFYVRVRTLFCLLLVLSLDPRGYSPGTPVFPSPQKLTFPNSNSTRNLVDEEPLIIIYLFIYLFIYSFELFKFHDFFHELAQFSMALGLVVTFETTFILGGFFYHTQFSIHNLVSTKRVSFALTNQQYLSHFVLALTLQ